MNTSLKIYISFRASKELEIISYSREPKKINTVPFLVYVSRIQGNWCFVSYYFLASKKSKRKQGGFLPQLLCIVGTKDEEDKYIFASWKKMKDANIRLFLNKYEIRSTCREMASLPLTNGDLRRWHSHSGWLRISGPDTGWKKKITKPALLTCHKTIISIKHIKPKLLQTEILLC